MITAIITAFKEPRTIGPAIESLLQQKWGNEYEVLVLCPDDETASIAKKYAGQFPQVKHIYDSGKGKPSALNLALENAKGDICVFTDGDVLVEPGSLEPLLALLKDPMYGAVTSRPVSASPRSTMFGYWSHLLTDAGAHFVRTRKFKNSEYLDCSGYLYAARKKLIPTLPISVLADDAYISQCIWAQGYLIGYAPEARVSVWYPTNYQDWLLQKVRSTAGAAEIGEHKEDISALMVSRNRKTPRMRSFYLEASQGLVSVLRYPKSLKEFWWTILLLAARLHLWIKVFLEMKIRHRSFHEIWKRVESTK